MAGVLEHTSHLAVRTAHARLKDAFYPILFGSIALSAGAHFVLLSYGTFSGVGDYSIHSGPDLEQVEVRREFELPPPPAEFARPAVPVISARADIDPDITIAAVTFEENPVEELPRPPTDVPGSVLEEQPVFTPYEVKPELRNGPEMRKLLEHQYPRLFRDAGIGGKVVLWVLIDEQGEVRNTKVVTSTGYPELDGVAERLLRESARFTPAYNRDQRVPVWIQIPIEFISRPATR
jgi:TonB family protein